MKESAFHSTLNANSQVDIPIASGNDANVDEADLNKQRHILEIESFKQDIEQRKQFANKIYWLVTIYLIFVGLLVFLCGLPIQFDLSDTILGIILGTTTANILALFHFVARYLFSEKQHERRHDIEG